MDEGPSGLCGLALLLLARGADPVDPLAQSAELRALEEKRG